MRSAMRKSVEGYSRVLRAETEKRLRLEDVDDTSEERTELDQELEELQELLSRHIEETAYRSSTDPEFQRQIVELQRRKQGLMLELKTKLREIDDPSREWKVEEGSRPVICREGVFIWSQEKEEGTREHQLTLGELVTDIAWGVSYSLDPATAPRRAHKLLAIEQTKLELGKLLDLQIRLEERNRKNRSGKQTGKFEMDINESRQNIFEKPQLNKYDKGCVAEQMVINFLKKLSIDFGLGIEVIPGDLYQDLEQKTDVVLKIKSLDLLKRKRRLSRTGEAVRTAGVQLTLYDPSHPKFVLKRNSVSTARGNLTPDDDIQDLIITSIPDKKKIPEQWEQWVRSGRPAGGPEKLWGNYMKKEVFKRVLSCLFEEDEVDRMWDELPNQAKVSQVASE